MIEQSDAVYMLGCAEPWMISLVHVAASGFGLYYWESGNPQLHPGQERHFGQDVCYTVFPVSF